MESEQFLDAILNLPDIQDGDWPKVSPDGRWVAWTWYQIGPTADVYVSRTDGSTGPIRMTETNENTWLAAWLPDSSGLLVEQDEDGNERAQLFRVDLQHPLEMTPLTEPRPNFYLRNARAHPNGHLIVYGANFDALTGQEIEQTWIYKHDLKTGERVPLAKPQKAGPAMPELNLQGTHILYSRKDLHPAGRQIWLVDIQGEQDIEILNVGPDRKVAARWLPNGKQAVVLAETTTHKRLGIWSMESAEVQWLIDDPARDIEDAFVPHRSDQIVVVENIQGNTHSSLVDLTDGHEYRLPQISGSLIPLAPNESDQWIGFTYSSKQPTDLVLFSVTEPNKRDFISLTRVWEQTKITSDDLTAAEDFSWQSVDGLEVHGWLYRSKQRAKGTIIYVHGGPTWHSQDWINKQIQFFASQGFNVMDPNYRGSTGYGLQFCEAIRKDGWGGREQEDIRTGIEALIAAGIAEPGKVGITGTSYGGYSSWFAITHHPINMIGAAAPICGMTDLVVDYETTRPDIRPYSEEMMGGTPEQVPERYYERSPINFLENIRGHLLIVQGEQDPNVTPENVRVVKSALEDLGIPYQILTFADEGHGISKPANQKVLYLKLLEFFGNAFGEDVGT